jgi:hypothetical protein
MMELLSVKVSVNQRIKINKKYKKQKHSVFGPPFAEVTATANKHSETLSVDRCAGPLI